MRFFPVLVGLFFIHSFLYAQDIHMSLFSESPVNINPASTGFYKGDFRFALHYRNQWRTASTNYNTILFTGEALFYASKNKRGKLTGGLHLYYDRAGDSRLSIFNIRFALAYARAFGRKKNHVFSFGLDMGYIRRGIFYNNLNFDSQYQGFQFDPNLPTREIFQNRSRDMPDIGTGVYYQFVDKRRHSFILGFAVAHVNRPVQSFVDNPDERLDITYTVQAKGIVRLRKRLDLLSEIMYRRQQTKQEILFNMWLKYYIKDRHDVYMAVYGGLQHRVQDALTVLAKFERNTLAISIAYDITVSKLLVANRTLGGIELAFVYRLSRKPMFANSKNLYCPIF